MALADEFGIEVLDGAEKDRHAFVEAVINLEVAYFQVHFLDVFRYLGVNVFLITVGEGLAILLEKDVIDPDINELFGVIVNERKPNSFQINL